MTSGGTSGNHWAHQHWPSTPKLRHYHDGIYGKSTTWCLRRRITCKTSPPQRPPKPLGARLLFSSSRKLCANDMDPYISIVWILSKTLNYSRQSEKSQGMQEALLQTRKIRTVGSYGGWMQSCQCLGFVSSQTAHIVINGVWVKDG